jgi:hypothetical protein
MDANHGQPKGVTAKIIGTHGSAFEVCGPDCNGETRIHVGGEFRTHGNGYLNPSGAAEMAVALSASASIAVGMGAAEAVMLEALCERLRQVHAEGYTFAHDDGHPAEMAMAAAAYAWISGRLVRGGVVSDSEEPPPWWPWGRGAWKPTGKSPRRMLVIAIALLCAEVERMDRAALDDAERSLQP